MTDAHDEAAKAIRRKLGCGCNTCQGMDPMGECSFMVAVSAALRKAAADEREICANLADEAHHIGGSPGALATRIRARAKGGA